MHRILAFLAIAAACSAQAITIVNSGSTNAPGFQIVVEKSGKAEYTPQARRGGEPPALKKIDKKIPKSLARRLYADTRAAGPLPSLPAPHCAKSASFGTRTYILFGGEESPDLSCGDGGDARLRALIRDVNETVALFRPR